jgi:uncharacterized coiled-coil protein SlyX
MARPSIAQSTPTPAQPAAETTEHETTEQKIEQLTAAVAQAQAQMDTYQKQLQEMQQQLTALEQQMAAEKSGATTAAAAPTPPQTSVAGSVPATSASTGSLEDIRERQAIQETQIATHEQTKVETESKYPLKVSGLILLNGFVNTRQVDVAADPTYAMPGSGSTGLSVRQTILGLDARGPHLFGATSLADVRVDFFGSGLQSGYATGGLLRLRTAHASLNWPHTQAFVQLDRSLLAPNAPSSLLAVAQPEFAWSGNLWTWNPQIGISQQLDLSQSTRIKLQAALIDVQDPQLPSATPSTQTISRAERSRWPGLEARIAFASGAPDVGAEIGVSGYFSPHETASQMRFDAWAGALDLRLPMGTHFELTGNGYRGRALGGLGGGGYVDYIYDYVGTTEIARGLDDVGGWAQLKAKLDSRLEFNGGFGIDNPFAKQIHASLADPDHTAYLGLARNRSVFGNVLYTPSSYLLFSIEYRRLWSNYPTGPANFSDVIGLGAGYKF